MPCVIKFLRHSSVSGLQTYFDWANMELADVDWNRAPHRVTEIIIAETRKLNREHRVRLQIDAERICYMADEIGQQALLGIVQNEDRETVMAQASAMDRSCWMYQHDPDGFCHAEDVRQTDQLRHGRSWAHYKVPAEIPLSLLPSSLRAFRSNVREQLAVDHKIKIEVFGRTIPDGDGGELDVVQLMVYQERLPKSFLEFNEEEDEEHLIAKVRRPVSEHAIIYSQQLGLIEVVAAKQDQRDVLAKALTTHLLQKPVSANSIPLRQFDLTPLVENRDLVWDAEDGIESVRLLMLKLVDREGDGRITVEIPALKSAELHEFVAQRFRGANPLVDNGFKPIQARMSIRFRPNNGSKRSKVLPIKISLPSGCDLRDRTERERLIGEKYFRRWGLIRDL